jgi:hypothetical protein
MWTLAFGHHEDRTSTHGYAATREAAMAAFAKSWRRQPATARRRAGRYASIALALTNCRPRRCRDRSCARPRRHARPWAFVPADAPSSSS